MPRRVEGVGEGELGVEAEAVGLVLGEAPGLGEDEAEGSAQVRFRTNPPPVSDTASDTKPGEGGGSSATPFGALRQALNAFIFVLLQEEVEPAKVVHAPASVQACAALLEVMYSTPFAASRAGRKGVENKTEGPKPDARPGFPLPASVVT